MNWEHWGVQQVTVVSDVSNPTRVICLFYGTQVSLCCLSKNMSWHRTMMASDLNSSCMFFFLFIAAQETLTSLGLRELENINYLVNAT